MMRRMCRRFLCIILILILLSVSSQKVIREERYLETTSMKEAVKGMLSTHKDDSRYSLHPPIHIVGNENFTSANGVVRGAGTENDPFIIEGWEIDSTGGTYCIWLEDTTAHCIIQNCILWNATNSAAAPFGAGVALNNARNCKLENNVIFNTYRGIALHFPSTNNLIIGNKVTNSTNAGIYLRTASSNNINANNVSGNYHGIYLYYNSNQNNITENILSNNTNHGIYVYSSSMNNISQNHLHNNSDSGIYLSSASNNNITANILSFNALAGIYLSESTNHELSGNRMLSNGIVLEGTTLSTWNSHIINSTNLINGKPVSYHKNQNSGAVPQGVGQVILAGCTNMVISNLSILNASKGIQLGFSNSNTIFNNSVLGNSQDGIYLYNSTRNIIQNNTAQENLNGILLYGSYNNISANRLFRNSNYGIRIETSENNNVSDNTVCGNSLCGIFLWISSNYNLVRDNDIYSNSYGIYIALSSNYNLVTYNVLYNNLNHGIYITSILVTCTGNTIHHNIFIGNNNGSCQAYDESNSNSWNLTSPKEGNYWNNWDGQDWGTASAYSLDGNAGAADWYPLNISLPIPPFAGISVNISSGSAPLSVQFTSNSSDPDGNIISYYWDFGDGNTSSEQPPNHTFTVAGNYSVRHTVIDNDGLTTTDSISITVLPPPNQPPQASFIANTTNGIAPLAVLFTSTSTDSDGTIAFYSWDF